MNQAITNLAAAEAAPLPAGLALDERPAAIDPEWDVAQIATRGHVLVARFERIYKKMLKPSLFLWGVSAIALALSYSQMNRSRHDFDSPLPRWISRALTYNPHNYFDVGGGLKSGPDYVWLAAFAPTPESLTRADYNALIKAVAADFGKHQTDAAKWEAVAALKTVPLITRPEKVFTEANAKELRNGVVAVPEGGWNVTVVAYVEGRWAVSTLDGSCSALVGPVPEGCYGNDESELSDGEMPGAAISELQRMKPKDKG